MSSGRYRVLASPAPVVDLVRRRREPVVVRTLRSTAAAVLAYLAALWLSGNAQPLLAPLTAVLVVQVTLYATLTLGVRRIASVVAGVLIAVGFADAVGLTWWSLGLLVLVCLSLGHLLHLAPWVEEVAVTGMLVLGVGGQRTEAVGRVIETLIGAAVGVLLNAVVAPPVYVEPAGEAIKDLAARLRLLLLRIGDELVHAASARHVAAWLDEARRLDHQTADVDAALARAEESLRLNPRGRPALGARLVLRGGLDAMEHCAVGLRSLCRSFADLAELRTDENPLYSGEVAAELRHLFGHLADAADRFGRLVTAEVAAITAGGAVPAAAQLRQELARALAQARAGRDRAAALLRSESDRDPEVWELHGALLALTERLMNELDIDRRLRASPTADRPEARRRRDRTTLGGLLRSLRSGELRRWLGGRVDPSRNWSFGRSGR
ncbi:aromatic acid exporter family protein [Streptomyces sp. NPDC005283]|uniref:FUSC family protein n=1 Tax=Streptomyces sp. NPDC005283 TaxID=3156871 RepID=UPI0034562048